MNKFRWLVLLYLLTNDVGVLAYPAKKLLKGQHYADVTAFSNRVVNVKKAGSFGYSLNVAMPLPAQKTSHGNLTDSLPKTVNDTVIIPFEYQQSSLYYPYTFSLMDSVAKILLTNELVTLSIDGYSYMDEADENICYWLSVNRALSVKYYVMGRGVDSTRIMTVEGRSNLRSIQQKAKKEMLKFHCTAEIILNYPLPDSIIAIQDTDEDGITDGEDSCINEYGEKAHNGCPDKNAIIVPFKSQQAALVSMTYKVLDSVVAILHKEPLLTISIEGHAYKKEGVETLCERLAAERADIVKRYLMTRNIPASRIESVKGFSNLRPLNAGRNSWEIIRNSRAEIFFTPH
ncbi:MAG: OmpA family protein [Ferruginibacter sp.]